jgi:hypothetical protein
MKHCAPWFLCQFVSASNNQGVTLLCSPHCTYSYWFMARTWLCPSFCALDSHRIMFICDHMEFGYGRVDASSPSVDWSYLALEYYAHSGAKLSSHCITSTAGQLQQQSYILRSWMWNWWSYTIGCNHYIHREQPNAKLSHCCNIAQKVWAACDCEGLL